MKKGQSILGILFFALLFGLCFQQNALNVEAKTRVIHKDITPKEAASSDLKVIKKVTKLAAHRWIQSYTMDSKYYYYIQMTSPYTGNLRITRVKYRGLGRYIKDHMDLKNLDMPQILTVRFRMDKHGFGQAVIVKGMMCQEQFLDFVIKKIKHFENTEQFITKFQMLKVKSI